MAGKKSSDRSNKCAYCGRAARLTREEIFPKSISEKVGFGVFIDQTRAGKPIGPVTVKDVCSSCNNGPLSLLDSYVAELYRKHLAMAISEPVDIIFEYRYDELLRWLLKAFYNAARARSGPSPAEALRDNVPYILASKSVPFFRTAVLTGVSVASTASDAEQKIGMPATFSPLVHKFGDLHFDDPSKESALIISQSVSINSFFFLVLGFRQEIADSECGKIIDGVARDNRLFELDPLDKKVRITRSVTDARTYLFSRGRFRFN
jgi:hypothetical protein